MTQLKITDDLQALLSVLPPSIAEAVEEANHSDDLLEVILDLGRVPTARFIDREIILRPEEVQRADLDYVIERIGEFDADNRAGIERTLHRISAIRNRRGHIVGLTCRVGRAVYGTTDIIKDLIESGRSLLILGRPGVGKTTMLREAARILAETKRVVIVDTSNEIGGDGDVPHPAVGRARRMQVSTPSLQHEVMIEAVENHNPEAIIIDEIGRELEAAAARTIAERGVQLIGTAHGNTLENLLLNPTLSDLVGGIESVTLSDEEARRRGTQKTVLERRSPPTFDVLIEIQTRDRVAVHQDVAAAVDALLRGHPLPPEIRYRDEQGEIHIEKAALPPRPAFGLPSFQQGYRRQYNGYEVQPIRSPEAPAPVAAESQEPSRGVLPTVRIYPYGVARNRLSQAVRRLGVPAVLVSEPSQADVVVTLRTYYRKRQQTIVDAERRNTPIHVLRANTVNQMQQFLSDLYNLNIEFGPNSGEVDYLREAQEAIEAVLNGERWVELSPANAAIRRIQHQMARQANLLSHSYGKEPNRRVRIFRDG
ncbi:MAG: R3H domain-containing nucleic acid-binding protein [Anaerolineales bacterium]|nr:AAA family ATPase [Anaerolineales bacterium]MCS7249029.1 AAA family ATPase [Anaerolineales bacterium]MDW8162842.1 R3H domain-containing nucleic acid-binding protein [Anaerolineales bacterium]MDW8447737.1 R3H domain-containing nucleic acid-binding protein [Anaerolineales bacterium]